MEVDAKSWAILAALQDNARQSLTELAQALRSGMLRETQERGALKTPEPPRATVAGPSPAAPAQPPAAAVPRRVVFKAWGTPGMPAPEH